MTISRASHPFALAAILAIPLAGCNEKAVRREVDAGVIPGGLTAEQARKPLARFGEHVITLGDFAQALADMPEYERLRYQSIERRRELLRSMVDIYLIADEAKRLGLDKDPIVAEETRQILVAWMRGKILSELPPPSAIPEAELRAYYDAHQDLYRDPERRRVAHVATRDEATAKRAADEARGASPTAWGGIVKKYSEEKPAGTEAPEMAGDIGYVTAPSDAHPPTTPKATTQLRAVVFALKAVGDVSAPFKDANGWHVVRLLAKNEAREQSFADVERSLRIRMLQDRRAAREREIVEEMRKSTKVQVDEASLSSLASELALEPAPSVSASATAAAPSASGSARTAPSASAPRGK